MQTRSIFRYLAIPMAVLALVGCATERKAISLGLSQLGTEEQVDAGGFFSDLKHRRSYNITGLGAVDTVGLVSMDPDPPFIQLPRLSRDRLPDNLAMRLSPDCSMVATVDYGPPAGADGKKPDTSTTTIATTRNALATVELAAADRASWEALQGIVGILKQKFDKVEAAQTASTTANAENKTAGDEAAKEGATAEVKAIAAKASTKALDATKNATQATTERDSFKTAIQTAWPGEYKLDDKKGVENALEAINGKLEGAKAAQNKAQAALDLVLNTPGVLISRWALAEKKVSAVGVADIASVDKQSADQQNGYLVLINPKVVTLMVGDDFLWRACRAKGANCKELDTDGKPTVDPKLPSRTGMDSAVPTSKQYVTTYQLLAQQWGWSEDRSQQRMRQITVHVDKLISTVTALSGGGGVDVVKQLSQIKLDVQLASSLSLNASNGGLMASPRIDIQAFSFATDDLHSRSVIRQLNAQSGYGRIISMRTSLDSYVISKFRTIVLPKGGPEHCTAKLAEQSISYPAMKQRCDTLGTEAATKACLADYRTFENSLQSWLQP